MLSQTYRGEDVFTKPMTAERFTIFDDRDILQLQVLTYASG
jgi:hypothetical protein